MSTLTLDETIGHLEQDGYAILEGLLGQHELGDLTDSLAELEAAQPRGRNEFEGRASTRVYSLAGKGDVFMRLAEHPRIVEVLDRLLLPNWLLSTHQSIRLHPGETPQPWHTDDAFYAVPNPRPRLAISVIWAIEAFTEENGATEILPGSHLAPRDPRADAVKALMPAGSAIVFDGRLMHRGGANRSKQTRLAISPQYCQPWLRTQESQLLIVPPDRAARCTARGRAMLGYSIHPPFIGQVDGKHPIRLVDPSYSSSGRAHLTEAAVLADRYLLPGSPST